MDVGLSTQGWLAWLGDVAKSAGIGAVFAAVGGALALVLVRRFRRHWWAPGARRLIVAFGVVTIWLFPVVIDPLFNNFEPLPPGQLRSDVLELADQAGVDVGEVYRVDASRRTTAANAYVNGLGHTKRVVLYDNLIEDFPRDEVRSVVAHELGHQKHDDVLRGLAWLALVAPAGTFRDPEAGRGDRPAPGARGPGAQARAGRAAGARAGAGAGRVRAGQRLERALAPGRGARRRVRARAHRATRRRTSQLERRLAVRNFADPDPPGLFQALFGTHPTTLRADRHGRGLREGEP